MREAFFRRISGLQKYLKIFAMVALLAGVLGVRSYENRPGRPEYGQACYKVGLEFERKNHLDKAVAYYRKAASEDPAFAQSYYRLGVVYDRKGDYPRKIEAWRKAMAFNFRDTPEVFYVVGMDDYVQGHVVSAITNFQRALSLHYNYGKVVYSLARLYRQLGDHENEIIYWQRTLRAEPQWFWAYVELGRAYYQKGDLPAAVAQLSELKELKQDALYRELSEVIQRDVE